MRWGNEIYIMAALFLYLEHHGGQLLIGHLPASPFVADVIVLAEAAHEIAMRKKDCAGAIISDQGRFFPKVGMITGDPGFLTGSANTCLPGETVNSAFSRADTTGPENCTGCFYLFLKQPFLVSFNVKRFRRRHGSIVSSFTYL